MPWAGWGGRSLCPRPWPRLLRGEQLTTRVQPFWAPRTKPRTEQTFVHGAGILDGEVAKTHPQVSLRCRWRYVLWRQGRQTRRRAQGHGVPSDPSARPPSLPWGLTEHPPEPGGGVRVERFTLLQFAESRDPPGSSRASQLEGAGSGSDPGGRAWWGSGG